MRLLFVHGYAGGLDDARTKGILSRDIEFYSEFIEQGIEPVVASMDVAMCPELVEAGVRHLALGSGRSGLMRVRRALSAELHDDSYAAVIADVTAAPLFLGKTCGVPILCRYEWYWSRVSLIEDRLPERELKAFLERQFLRRATGVIASTNSLAASAVASGASKTWVVPVFVANPFFDTPHLTAETSPPFYSFLCVGRHVAVKRFDVAVSALSRVSTIDRVRLELVGSGPETQRIREMASASGVALVEHGTVPNDRLPDIFAHATALLHPSLNEGMPRVLLEALACGLPVFAGRSSGSEEILGDGGNRGVLVGDSTAEWAYALNQAMESGALNANLGTIASEAREWAVAHVSASACVHAFADAVVDVRG